MGEGDALTPALAAHDGRRRPLSRSGAHPDLVGVEAIVVVVDDNHGHTSFGRQLDGKPGVLILAAGSRVAHARVTRIGEPIDAFGRPILAFIITPGGGH